MPLALALLLLAAGWRVAAIHVPALVNFTPLMALAFCGAVYFSDRRLWLVPLAALVLSDLYLDQYYATTFGETWTWQSVVTRALCFALALPLGRMIAQHKNWFTLLGGALAGSLLAQYQGFADVQMGIGMVVWGLASVIIGEALVGSSRIGLLITGAVIGSVLFRLLVAIALRWGLNPNDLKLITAAFVFVALVAPSLLRKLKPAPQPKPSEA